MKIREYSGPLTVFAAGVLGFSLICIVSAAALVNPKRSEASDFGAQDVVDSAFSNPINTAAALTAVEISEYVPTLTPTFTLDPTITASVTPTKRLFVTWTPAPPTRTRMARSTATSVPTQIPSRTPTRIPPTFTLTPKPPTDTNTPEPPPTDTDTPEPPPTDTNTPEPPPIDTDTPVPPADTPTPLQLENTSIP